MVSNISLCSPQKLGKISNLTSIFFQMGAPNNQVENQLDHFDFQSFRRSQPQALRYSTKPVKQKEVKVWVSSAETLPSTLGRSDRIRLSLGKGELKKLSLGLIGDGLGMFL